MRSSRRVTYILGDLEVRVIHAVEHQPTADEALRSEPRLDDQHASGIEMVSHAVDGSLQILHGHGRTAYFVIENCAKADEAIVPASVAHERQDRGELPDGIHRPGQAGSIGPPASVLDPSLGEALARSERGRLSRS